MLITMVIYKQKPCGLFESVRSFKWVKEMGQWTYCPVPPPLSEREAFDAGENIIFF
jgi:hypothetical protein